MFPFALMSQILKTILPELKAKGYHVVTLSHLHSLTSPPVTISSSSESDIVMKTGTQRWSWCQRVSMNVVMDTVKETFTRWWSRFQQVSMTVVMGNGDSKRDIYSKVVWVWPWWTQLTQLTHSNSQGEFDPGETHRYSKVVQVSTSESDPCETHRYSQVIPVSK